MVKMVLAKNETLRKRRAIWELSHAQIVSQLSSVQETAREMEFNVDGKELPHGEADGTGIGIEGIAKRGKALKVFVQYKRGGGVRVAGIDVGNYNGGWKKLFENSIEALKGFRRFLLIASML